jgi:hypothetical protein
MIAQNPSGLFCLRSIPRTGAARKSAGIIGNVALGGEAINNKELIRVARYGTLVHFRSNFHVGKELIRAHTYGNAVPSGSNFHGAFSCVRLPCFVRGRDAGRVPAPIFFNRIRDALTIVGGGANGRSEIKSDHIVSASTRLRPLVLEDHRLGSNVFEFVAESLHHDSHRPSAILRNTKLESRILEHA